MEGKLVRMSEVFLFGTRHLLEHHTRDEVIDIIMRSTPDARLLDNPCMDKELAEEILNSGIYPEENKIYKNWREIV